ncbi:MAG TPA: hypothetical protein VGB74_11505, partial [Actinoplanes sp.]
MSGQSDRAGQWRRHSAALYRDPVLRGLLALTVLAGLLFAVQAGNTAGQLRVFWLLQPPTDLVLAICSWRLHRIATGAIRRFWLVAAGAGSLFTVGDTHQSALALLTPEKVSTSGDVVQTSCFAVGLGL